MKKLIILLLCISTVSFMGCSNSSKSQNNNATQQVKAEKNETKENQTEENSKDNTSDKSQSDTTKSANENTVKIALDGFKKYFDIELKAEDIKDKLLYRDTAGLGNWIMSYKDKNAKKVYTITILQDGTIAGIIHRTESNTNSSKMNEKEAQEIGKAFIKNKNLSDKNFNISYIGIGNNGDFDFTVGEDKITGKNKEIYLHIDAKTQKVIGFDSNAFEILLDKTQK